MTDRASVPPDPTPAVVAFDVGNSKTDVAIVSADGSVLGALRGPTSSHQQVGLQAGFATLTSLAERAARQAGLDACGPTAGADGCALRRRRRPAER